MLFCSLSNKTAALLTFNVFEKETKNKADVSEAGKRPAGSAVVTLKDSLMRYQYPL